MKYAEARSLIRDGDVLAFRGTRLFSKIIKLWTRSRVSHVGVACWMHGRLTVVEALEGVGVRVFPLSRYIEQRCRVDWYELLQAERDTIRHGPLDRSSVVAFSLSKWGLRYASPWQFLRSWGWLSRWAAVHHGVPDDTNPDRFFCSELVLDALRSGGYRGEGYDKPAAKTTPADVIELPCLRRRGRLDP
jgi:hypothetical protein